MKEKERNTNEYKSKRIFNQKQVHATMKIALAPIR